MPLKDAIAQAAGHKTAAFPTPGTTVGGRIIAAELRQATAFGSNEPQFWDDGNPRMNAVISVETDESEDPDDDGVRQIFIKWFGLQRAALVAAVKAAGDDDTRIGGQLFAQYVRDEPSTKGNPQKIFSYRYIPPTSSAMAGAFDPPEATNGHVETPAAPPVTQPPPPAPAAPATVAGELSPAAKMQKIQGMIALGFSDAQIAADTTLELPNIAAVAAVRAMST